MTQKTKLIGGPEKTVTWIWMEAGHLKIEYYDFSEDAQGMFGNDVAYTLFVVEMEKLYSVARQPATSIVAWMVKNFKSYFAVRNWLEEKGIGFSVEIESHA